MWSPDGRSIAFLSSRDMLPHNHTDVPPYVRLEVMPVSGFSRRLIDTGHVEGVRARLAHIPPRWSPDSKQLAYVVVEGDVSPGGDGTYAIVVTGLFDEKRHRLTPTVSAPAWSPDGSRVAFARASQDGLGL